MMNLPECEQSGKSGASIHGSALLILLGQGRHCARPLVDGDEMGMQLGDWR